MPKHKYEEGENVYGLDQGRLYEARIVKYASYKNINHYYIAYKGWPRKWNCWVPESLLTKEREINKKEKEKEKVAAALAAENENSDGSNSANNVANTKSKKAKARLRGIILETETVANAKEDEERKKRAKALMMNDIVDDSIQNKGNILFKLPLDIQKIMCHEWSLLTNEPKRLIKLPRQDSIDDDINKFLEFKKQKADETQMVQYQELFDSIRKYFNHALPKVLLYRYEIAQYIHLRETHSNKTLTSIYGLEHLVRLFAVLPSVMGPIVCSVSERTIIQNQVEEFLKFIVKHKKFDANDYFLESEFNESISNGHSNGHSNGNGYGNGNENGHNVEDDLHEKI